MLDNAVKSDIAQKPGPSRPLDVHRWSDYRELNDCLADLVTEISALEGRARARSRQAAIRFRNAVRSIILDLYVAWLTSPALEVGVLLGKSRFGVGSRYDQLFLTYDAFRPALSGLMELGYVEFARRHFHDPRTGIGRSTRVRATQKLISLLTDKGDLTLARVTYRTDRFADEVIVLRDGNEDKTEIAYADTKATRQMRSEVERINALLASQWIDVYITDDEMAALNARMTSDYLREDREAPYIDFAARRLRRIFNNGVWTDGGRFYGGWWQSVPKDSRKWITINGKHTVELDYSVMHPTLLYAEVGASLEGDAYDIGVPSVRRDVIKQVFNQLVNAEGRIVPKADFNEQECELSWSELQNKVKARHQPIAKYLGTGHGVVLQNKDAAIANRIMLRFASMNYVCLPVHDSFIVHRDLKDELVEVMSEVFFKETGTNIRTKLKADVLSTIVAGDKDDKLLDHHAVLEEAIGGKGKYAGYETRLNNWWGRGG